MADIILYDKSGNPVTYTNTETLTVDTTTEGEQQVFSKGVAVEGLEISTEFAGGDMLLVAAENTLVKSAVIKKPDTLIPENIRNGITIGGIDGTYIGETEETTVELDLADGDQIVSPPTEGKALSKVTIQKPETLLPENILKNVVIAGVRGSYEVLPKQVASGTFTPTAAESTVTVTHNLGMIPDIVFISAINPTVTVNGLRHAVSMSNGLAKAVGEDNPQNLKVYAGNAGILGMSVAYGIDDDNPETAIMVHGAGAKTFKVTGASLATFVPNKEHSWSAFCGIVPHNDYFYIQLSVENYTTLIVTGGVPEIQQLEIYVDGSLAKTVDYIYEDTFVVDVSDVADDYTPHTFTVKALGDTLAETRPKQYYDSVSNGILAGGTCGDSAKWKLTATGDMTIFGSGAMADYSAESGQPWYAYASKINTVTVENGITHIGNQSLRATALTSVSLPDTVTSLGVSAFLGCTGLTTFDIPDSVNTIGNYCFNECSGLTSIVIPEGITSITYCFYKCTALAAVTLPSTLVTLGKYTFSTCTKLTTIDLPAALTTIGVYAFTGCSALTSATFRDTTTWKYYASETATSGSTISSSYLANISTAATYLRSTYVSKWWKKT